jgi:hypothetical protein
MLGKRLLRRANATRNEAQARGATLDFSSLPQFPGHPEIGPATRSRRRSSRRRRRSLAGTFVCFAVYAAVVCFLRPWDAINPLQYSRVQLGMSVDKVEAMTGLPPGRHQSYPRKGLSLGPGTMGFMFAQSGLDNTKLPSCWPNSGQRVVVDDRLVERKQWWGNRYAIEVAIDETGAVVGRYLIKVHLEDTWAEVLPFPLALICFFVASTLVRRFRSEAVS